MSANHLTFETINKRSLNGSKGRMKSLWLRFLIAGIFALGGWQILTSGYFVSQSPFGSVVDS